MLAITIQKMGQDPEQFSSEKTSLMIGKAEGNDICIQAEGVSRYHARISLEGADVVLEDLDSTNGTYVNSERISKKNISPEDKIAIGRAVLSLAPEAASSTPAQTNGAGMDDGSSTIPPPTSSSKKKAPAAKAKASADGDEKKMTKDDLFYMKSLEGFLSPVWKYVEEEAVSEIMINGADEIYVERKGSLDRVEETFNPDQLQAAVLNIAQYVGRRVSEEEPALDARLPDGSRVAVLLPPCSRKGISIAIRKFSKERLTVEKLVEFGSMTPEIVTFLKAAVGIAKNIVVSGGTSSGKTSLLNVLSSLIPATDRIITIEDAAELQLVQPHIVPMETKPPDKKGKGQVTIRDLLKVSLRMRPDRIVVGEIRGGEALDLLQAMNTGHSGSMATLHANNPTQALSRLETLALFSGFEIPMQALREQVSGAIDLVIQAARLPDHSRKVTHVSEVSAPAPDGSYVVNDIFRFVRKGTDEEGKITGDHEWTGYVPSFIEELRLAGFEEAVSMLEGKKK